MDLTAGMVNVLDYADLFVSGSSFASQITYADDVPASDTPVVVRVPAGTTDVRGIEFGTSGQYPKFVMWDLSAVTGPVVLTDKQGGTGRVDGSVYAPYAALTLRVGPLDGQVIADSLIMPAGTGELHAYMFASTLACETSPAPSASPSASPSTSPSSSPTPSATVGGEDAGNPTADATPTPGDQNSGDPATDSLANTGAQATVLTGISLALGAVGVGLLLATSRRRA